MNQASCKMNMRGLLAGLAMAVALVKPACALTTFYSDFGPGTTYSTTQGYTVSGASTPDGYLDYFMPFTAATSGALTQIDIGLTYGGGSNDVTVYLLSDASGLPYLPSIINFSPVFAMASFQSTSNSVVTIDVPGINLVGGRKYWLEVEGDESTIDYWNDNVEGATGTYAYLYLGFSLSSEFTGSGTLGAFDLLGTGPTPLPSAIPLPATLPLIATSLGALGLLRWRKKHKAKALPA